MKAILVLCLLVTLNCNLIDTALCIYKNEKVRYVVGEAISAFKSKDWIKIVSLVLQNFEEVKSIVMNCLDDVDDEPVLKTPIEEGNLCLKKCKDLGDYHERKDCYLDCVSKQPQ